MPAAQGEIHFTVNTRESGLRLDTFVSERLPQYSRSQTAAWIRQGVLHVDGVQRKAGYKVKPGEQISGYIPAAIPVALVPEPIAFDILYEDRALIVVDKPAGLVVHPAAGHFSGTLVNGLLHHCPDLEGIGGERRPGIVHRLDKDTSGVLVVAKNAQAHQSLAQQFKARQVYKTYLAIVAGSPHQSSGRIELPVGRHPVERKKMSVVSPRGREAITLWQVRERFAGATLLEVELKTGRTHQIRVHCQSMGLPIVGDPLYGRKRALQQMTKSNTHLQSIFQSAHRQMLHAAQLRFTHPLSGAPLFFETPIPEDMAEVLQSLRQQQRPRNPNP